MADSRGITFFDGAGGYVKIEYSTQIPPATASTWIIVGEAKQVGRNPEASPEIEFTKYDSTEQELRLGLPRRGSWDVTCNYAPEDTTQEAIIALDASKQARWWKITYPLANTSHTSPANERFAGYVQTTAIAPPSATEDSPADFNFTVKAKGSYIYARET